MSLKTLFTHSLVALATVGIVMPAPQQVMAATTTQGVPAIQDVALTAGGTLRGQVLTEEGAPAAGTVVAVEAQGVAVQQATTDQNGEFAVSGLRGGVYVVHAAGTSTIYRAWAEGTAPPRASQGALIVANQTTARGHLDMYSIGLGGALVLGIGGTIIALAARDRDGS